MHGGGLLEELEELLLLELEELLEDDELLELELTAPLELDELLLKTEDELDELVAADELDEPGALLLDELLEPGGVLLELDENDASCEGGDAATSIRASGAPFPPFPPFPLFPPYPPYPPYPPCPPNPPVCPERPLIREPCADDHTDDNGANLGPPGWTDPDENGWQCWSAIFTLPITRANWPPRYHGAPDPAVTSVEDLTHSDMQEASRRLGALRLSADRTDAEQVGDLADIRAELDRLVVAFPTRLLADVPLNDSDAGANAPSLRLSLLEKLLILAVDPYLARVLGLYFVDEDADPGVDYDYCIAGDWGATQAAVRRLHPGLAPAGLLAKGELKFDGLSIAALSPARLWRWTRDDASGARRPMADPGAPSRVAAAFDAALAGLGPNALPQALLGAHATGISFPTPMMASVSIGLRGGWPRVDLQAAGKGTVLAFAANKLVATASFDSTALTTLTLSAAPNQDLIDRVLVNGQKRLPLDRHAVLVIGAVELYQVASGSIGWRHALLHAPQQLSPLTAPATAVATFRHRDADVDPATRKLRPRSLIDVEWAPDATPDTHAGDPVDDPINLPAPTRPVGFIVQRVDTGVANSAERLPRRILAASSETPKGSRLTSARLYRFSDGAAADPVGSYAYRAAGFDLFGALGAFAAWSAPVGVERIAASPTVLRIRGFDNRLSAGGGPQPQAPAAPVAWDGGTLHVTVGWSGAAFAAYPDLRSARLIIEGVDVQNGSVTGVLATRDIATPAPNIAEVRITSVTTKPLADGGIGVEIATQPPLAHMQDAEPSALLVLCAPDGGRERHVVRSASTAPGSDPVARFKTGGGARIGARPNDFVGQTAYVVYGYSVDIDMPVPLSVPLAARAARAQATVAVSLSDPFVATDAIVDPNGLRPPRPQPRSAPVAFVAPQRLTPPAPPTPEHEVHHVYYDPADKTGQARKTLPFDTKAQPGVDGFVLHRASVHAMIVADVKRRLAVQNAADPQPTVLDAGAPRPDLKGWIAALPEWLSAYNKGGPTRPPSSLTLANVLSDNAARAAFNEHFYGGLLDDELRALADLPENLGGFARVNPKPLQVGAPGVDSVDGGGYGRTFYKLASVNAAASGSALTGAIGPYYTRVVTPPRAPVVYKIQATSASIVVAWALDDNNDVAGYLVYRGAEASDLADLRWFGPNPEFPSATGVAAILSDPKRAYPLSFGPGAIDPRIIALKPDPRLCARDYEGGDMGEIPLPPGVVPDAIDAVYRLSDYQASRAPLDQPQAFNYWTPPKRGGIAQLVVDGPGQARIKGLRIGLGRRVPVVVVVSSAGAPQVLGDVGVRRLSLTDGVSGGAPLDPDASSVYAPPAATGSNFYAVVAVDVHGNRSAGSKIFAASLSPTA